jgi:archaellum biogenesis ATPase FlaH
LEQRLGGTGQWFLGSPQYTQWKETGPSFLWLHGIPGSGKSILSAGILGGLMEAATKDVGKAVAFFYFDFADNAKKSCSSMTRVLISQLSQKCVKVPPSLDALYESCGKGQHQASTDTLISVLTEIIVQFPETYLVIDAVDECDDRDHTLKVLERLGALKSKNLHLLITSRDEADIRESATSFIQPECCLDLQAALVDVDIRQYISHRWETDKTLRKWKGHPIRIEAEKELLNKSNRMQVSQTVPPNN